MNERIKQAGLLYQAAIFGGDPGPLDEADRELDTTEAELTVARGKVMHARFLLGRDADPATADWNPGELALFERAVRLYQELGNAGGEAEALFWVGCYHQVALGDDETATPILERSHDLASRAGDQATAAEALRHLGIAAHRSGDLNAARQRLTDSTQLRRESGNLPGVASNLIGLAYVAAAQGRPADAQAHLAEASEIAQAHGAHRLLGQISEARAELAIGHDGQ